MMNKVYISTITNLSKVKLQVLDKFFTLEAFKTMQSVVKNSS